MEESSLDDFFAKKDKTKKKSTKGSKLTPGDILKQVEKPKKSAKKIRDKENPKQTCVSVSGMVVQEDDEWKDYQEEEQKDFSDLKIQNLQIVSTDDKEDIERMEGSGSEDEDGEGREKKDASGPWNKASSSQPVTNADLSAEVEKPELPKPEPPKSAGKYIPPAARRAMECGSSTLVGPSHIRKKKAAPDVMSELDFPTLRGGLSGGEVNYDSGSIGNTGRFEQVRSGGRQTEDPRAQAASLELGNKYDALAGTE